MIEEEEYKAIDACCCEGFLSKENLSIKLQCSHDHAMRLLNAYYFNKYVGLLDKMIHEVKQYAKSEPCKKSKASPGINMQRLRD